MPMLSAPLMLRCYALIDDAAADAATAARRLLRFDAPPATRCAATLLFRLMPPLTPRRRHELFDYMPADAADVCVAYACLHAQRDFATLLTPAVDAAPLRCLMLRATRDATVPPLAADYGYFQRDMRFRRSPREPLRASAYAALLLAAIIIARAVLRYAAAAADAADFRYDDGALLML